jgi:glyceraldehyde 3-phosphate dehydrogenase
MAVNIAINGFGRLGRLVFSRLSGDKTFEVAAINDRAAPELLAWLLKYETPQGGRSFAEVQSGPGFISLRGKNIKTYSETGPAKLPWKKLKVDLVLDCTGAASPKEQAAAHRAAGAKKVFIAPPDAAYPGIVTDLPVILYGLNEKAISAGAAFAAPSPALSSLAPLVKVLNDFAPIRSAILSAGLESTAIASAIARMIPELQGKLTGSGAAVSNAALLTAVLHRDNKGMDITAEALNKALKGKIDPAGTLALPIGEGSYQVQIAALYGSEDAYAAGLVKTLQYFAEFTAEAKGRSSPPERRAVVPKAPQAGKTTAPKSGAPKPVVQKPAGGAKPVNPVLHRKPLINVPK